VPIPHPRSATKMSQKDSYFQKAILNWNMRKGLIHSMCPSCTSRVTEHPYISSICLSAYMSVLTTIMAVIAQPLK
jgi:hypothetical protein